MIAKGNGIDMGHARNDTTGKAHATFEIIREHRARQPVFGRVRESKRMIFIPRFQDRQHRPVCSLLGEMPASNLKGASLAALLSELGFCGPRR